MAIFQIFTQEGWVEVLNECAHAVEGGHYYYLIALYFVAIHLYSYSVSDSIVCI